MENVNEPGQDVRKEEDNGDDNEEDVNPDLEEEVAKNEGKAEEEEAFPGKENNGAIEAVLIGRDINQSINQSTLFKHGKWLSKLVFRHAV